MEPSQQAATQLLLEELLPRIKGQRTTEEKEWASANHDDSHQRLKVMRDNGKNGNRNCADCGETRPQWVSFPQGIFLCVNCAQVHRGLGRNISQIQSMASKTYLFYRDQLECLESMGNNRANGLFLANFEGERPDPDMPRKEIERHIKNKYVNLLWFSATPSQQRRKRGETAKELEELPQKTESDEVDLWLEDAIIVPCGEEELKQQEGDLFAVKKEQIMQAFNTNTFFTTYGL